MFTDEQEIISNINSDLEYTHDQVEQTAYFYCVVSNVRYQMKDGKRLSRSIILHRETGELFKLEPVKIVYADLTESERKELDDRVKEWNQYKDKETPKLFVKSKLL